MYRDPMSSIAGVEEGGEEEEKVPLQPRGGRVSFLDNLQSCRSKLSSNLLLELDCHSFRWYRISSNGRGGSTHEAQACHVALLQWKTVAGPIGATESTSTINSWTQPIRLSCLARPAWTTADSAVSLSTTIQPSARLHPAFEQCWSVVQPALWATSRSDRIRPDVIPQLAGRAVPAQSLHWPSNPRPAARRDPAKRVGQVWRAEQSWQQGRQGFGE